MEHAIKLTALNAYLSPSDFGLTKKMTAFVGRLEVNKGFAEQSMTVRACHFSLFQEFKWDETPKKSRMREKIFNPISSLSFYQNWLAIIVP